MSFWQDHKSNFFTTFSKLDFQERRIERAKKQLFNTLLLKGQFSELLNKPDEAIGYLEQAYELYPDFGLCQKLIFLCDLTGDKEKVTFYRRNLNSITK